jgi:type II secretory ATPase GspE/PulE/Tfp pilus assembly ATPase PilB-like protein
MEAAGFVAVGCGRCRQSGYRGRIGLFEGMNVTDEIRSLIVTRAPAHEISRLAVAQGMRTLHDDGLAKIAAGETTRAELTRVLG